MTALATTPDVTPFASPIDAGRFGEHQSRFEAARFTGRIESAEPGRYHVYGARSRPSSHRLAIIRELAGLADVVSMSYVDTLRDARGWAFRADTGADPVNGFTLLSQAYTATQPGYDGPVTVPVLWDRHAAAVRSNDATAIGVDLMTAFGPSSLWAGVTEDVERVAAWSTGRLEQAVASAAFRPEAARNARLALRELDEHLARHPFLVADRLTDADIRVWVELVRFDAGANAHGRVGPHLDAYPALWRWARGLYGRPAFRETTDFAAFSAPFATLPAWD